MTCSFMDQLIIPQMLDLSAVLRMQEYFVSLIFNNLEHIVLLEKVVQKSTLQPSWTHCFSLRKLYTSAESIGRLYKALFFMFTIIDNNIAGNNGQTQRLTLIQLPSGRFAHGCCFECTIYMPVRNGHWDNLQKAPKNPGQQNSSNNNDQFSQVSCYWCL